MKSERLPQSVLPMLGTTCRRINLHQWPFPSIYPPGSLLPFLPEPTSCQDRPVPFHAKGGKELRRRFCCDGFVPWAKSGIEISPSGIIRLNFGRNGINRYVSTHFYFELFLAKARAAGLNPVSRSSIFNAFLIYHLA